VKGFRHLDLHVDRRVLIPRPETETLVEAVVEILPQGARVHDLGTGSGAVALALKDERPDLVVSASDVSNEALAVARGNAERLGLDVEFTHTDLLGVGDVDAVVSNPPYVEDGAELAPEIVRHEPSLALRAGPEGLDVLRLLVPAAAALGAKMLAVEVGAGQAEAVQELAAAAGFTASGRHADLAGIDRVVVAWR
jgi:release factor glutamine methyltransferase